MVEKIIRNRWQTIKNTTRYGWLTSYYQCSQINLINAESLVNLAIKVGNDNCNIVVKQIKQITSDVHPNKIPIIAEALLSEMYTMILIEQRSKKSTWTSEKIQAKEPSVFTISSSIF
ncbi:hypothetical protein HCN44_004899 [Aphidius gifuensis]|uniref:Uncharacterized protein n=1 Tax=Aphidius gifuensis TaxID=684658 RepID=A0A834XRX9_APHGI|nr:hypothetical protein HCN44_008749 [Aphidius gifuensis]KAF7992555.1 hypothetical protein HCN44_004899 [Aphidius gifuensis]